MQQTGRHLGLAARVQAGVTARGAVYRDLGEVGGVARGAVLPQSATKSGFH
jgi:hypothetical protein